MLQISTRIQPLLQRTSKAYSLFSHLCSQTRLTSYLKKNSRRNRITNLKFVDTVRIEVRGGKGGSGCVAYKGLGPGINKPDGGNGGKGGDVYIIADRNVSSLRFEHSHFNADNGKNGGSDGMTGRGGEDLFIRVPIGTLIYERHPDDDEEEEEGDEEGEEEGEVEGEDGKWEEIEDEDEEDETGFRSTDVEESHREDPDEETDFEKWQRENPDEEIQKDERAKRGGRMDRGRRGGGGGRRRANKIIKNDDDDDDDDDDVSLKKIEEDDEEEGVDLEEDEDDDDEEEEETTQLSSSSSSSSVSRLPSFDLSTHNDCILVARGGGSGIGNKAWVNARSKSQQTGRSLPKVMPGKLGEMRYLLLEMKVIGDVGLVGFPNAGKSSLLASLSKATPTIAPYPFTTLNPYVGMVEYSDMERISIADIPGLVEGAHLNRGLGHEFLKHVERTKVLLYVIDGSTESSSSPSSPSAPLQNNLPGSAPPPPRSPASDFLALREELRLYNEELLSKPSLIFANKLDLKASPTQSRELVSIARKYGIKIMKGSAMEGKGLQELAKELRVLVHSTSLTNDSDNKDEDDNNKDDDERMNKSSSTTKSSSSTSSSTSSSSSPLSVSNKPEEKELKINKNEGNELLEAIEIWERKQQQLKEQEEKEQLKKIELKEKKKLDREKKRQTEDMNFIMGKEQQEETDLISFLLAQSQSSSPSSLNFPSTKTKIITAEDVENWRKENQNTTSSSTSTTTTETPLKTQKKKSTKNKKKNTIRQEKEKEIDDYLNLFELKEKERRGEGVLHFTDDEQFGGGNEKEGMAKKNPSRKHQR